MKWENDPAVSGQQVYHLYKSGKKILTLHFNPSSRSARIYMEQEKRVVLLRKEGFLKKRTVLRSEYGIKIAELGHEAKGDFIEIDERRYYYELRPGSNPQLMTYREPGGKPFITCSLDRLESERERSAGFSTVGLLMALSSAVLPASAALSDLAI